MEVSEYEKMAAGESQFASKGNVTIIGLYGISGSGKSFLMRHLKDDLKDDFAFYEGSEVVASVRPGGLDAFHGLDEQSKSHWRQAAIKMVKQKRADSGRPAIVAGHLTLWSERQEAALPIYTENDLRTYTHILYLDIPTNVVAQRRLDDTCKSRSHVSIEQLAKWQSDEKKQLRHLCRHHNILFMALRSHTLPTSSISFLLRDFSRRSEAYNWSQAKASLEQWFFSQPDDLQNVLVLDADRTLTSEDTGALFWERIAKSQTPQDEEDPLKTLFNSPLGYSYTAFHQAVMLYEEVASDEEFEGLCEDIALATTMHPEFVSLLQLATQQSP